MKISENEIFISVKSYGERITKITEIATLPKSTKFLDYQRYLFQILITQFEDLNEDFVKFLRPYLLNFF